MEVEGVGWRWWMGLWLEVAGVLVVVVLVAGVGGGVVGWRDGRGGAGMAGGWFWRGCVGVGRAGVGVGVWVVGDKVWCWWADG